jgi:hypothetical protein
MSQQQQQQQKIFLFISNRCQHSKRLMMRLQKTSLMNNFQIINVDDPRIQLPQFVSCVPTLYIPSKRQVFTDADLFQWFDNELQGAMAQEQKKASFIDMANITGDASILPFQMSEMGNGLAGAAYSFIEEDKNDLMNQNYSFLQDRDINKMPDFTRHDAPKTSDGFSSNQGSGNQQRKTGGEIDRAYEALMQSRGSEMQQRMPPQTPNFNSPY